MPQSYQNMSEETKERFLAKKREWYQQNKDRHKQYKKKMKAETSEFIRSYKLSKGCKNCGYNRCSASLDLHHRDPSKKEFTISEAVASNTNYGLERLKAELEKCDVLCSNCHREHHYLLDGPPSILPV